MKALKFSFVLAVGVMQFITSFAQEISFESKTHNYGEIFDTDGAVSHDFVFTNSGSSPLVITRVKAGCGCTATHYTTDSIAPGKTGFITAQFNPRGYNNQFRKSITIQSNATNEPTVILYIEGTVINKSQKIIETYPVEFNIARLTKNSVNYGSVEVTQIAKDTIGIYNMQDTAISVLFAEVPEHITIEMQPSNKLQAQEAGIIIFSYNADKKEDFGRVSNDVIRVFYEGYPQDFRNRISFTATIHEDFSLYTKRMLKKAARIQFEYVVFDFDTVPQQVQVEAVFPFKNTGKSELVIRKIGTTCGCTAGTIEKRRFKKGESGVIPITFNVGNRRENQQQKITVYTNDPKNPMVEIFVRSYVKVQD